MICDVCERTFAKPTAFEGLCPRCVKELRPQPLPPPCRRAAPCMRCNGMRFARSIPHDFTLGEGGVAMTVGARPRSVANSFLEGRTLLPGKSPTGAGALEMYTCLGCGFVEWYCRDPKAIRIGLVFATDVVDYATDQPYR